MVEDGLDKVNEPTVSGDKRISDLEVELERVKKLNGTLEELNKKLDDQLKLKLSTLKDPEQFIPKKTAALEVYKEIIMSKNTYIYAMVTAFIIAASAAYFAFIGAIVAGIVCMGFAVMMLKKMKKIKYLEDKYQLIRPKLFKKAE